MIISMLGMAGLCAVIEIIRDNSDLILTICSLSFSISLIPTLIYNWRHKLCEIPYSTSILTAFFLAIVTLVYISNGFFMSSIVGALTTIIWIGIAAQRYTYNNTVIT